MKTYIALLRGINVSGQKKIRMADLKAHLKELGYEGIQTYIQSGNIIFRSREYNPVHLAHNIQQKLFDKYKFNVPTLVLSPDELLHIISHNPFILEHGTITDRLYVTFLLATPRADLSRILSEQKKHNEHFVHEDKIIFLYYPDGYGKAVMNNNAFEKTLQVEATTRNWKTVNKLYEMTKDW
jgi:uncharacterized protein (DUF1697 family)